MINSEKDFKGVGSNVDNVGSGCMYIVLAVFLLIIYVIVF